MAYSPKELADALERAEPITAEVMLRAGQLVEGAVREAIVARLTRDPTGALARSVTTTLTATDPVAVTVLVDRVYAEIQDQGGTIRPKRGKYLAVPTRHLPASMRGKGPRDWAPDALSWRPTKKPGTGGVLVDAGGRALYVLRTSVRIPGVRYIDHALDAVADDLAAELGASIAARVPEE